MDSARRRCEARLRHMTLPDPFDLAELCQTVSARRGRPLHVRGIPGPAPLDRRPGAGPLPVARPDQARRLGHDAAAGGDRHPGPDRDRRPAGRRLRAAEHGRPRPARARDHRRHARPVQRRGDLRQHRNSAHAGPRSGLRPWPRAPSPPSSACSRCPRPAPGPRTSRCTPISPCSTRPTRKSSPTGRSSPPTWAPHSSSSPGSPGGTGAPPAAPRSAAACNCSPPGWWPGWPISATAAVWSPRAPSGSRGRSSAPHPPSSRRCSAR